MKHIFLLEDDETLGLGLRPAQRHRYHGSPLQ